VNFWADFEQRILLDRATN